MNQATDREAAMMASDVTIDVPEILALSKRLRAEAEAFDKAAESIRSEFDVGGIMSPSTQGDMPYGADARNQPASAVMAIHRLAVERARQLIDHSRDSMYRASRLTEAIAMSLRGQDESDAANLAVVTRMLNIPRSAEPGRDG